MRLGALEKNIFDIISPSIEDMDYSVVRIRFFGENKSKTLQIMIERSSGDQVNVDDCAVASRTISMLLEVDDPVDGAYHLEVSSAGLDRPLTRLADFERFKGFIAKIETEFPIDGRRRFRGELLGNDGDDINIEIDGKQYKVPFDRVDKAKLVLTDHLMEFYKNQESKDDSDSELCG